MTDVTYKRNGGRIVELYIPIQIGNREVSSVELAAVRLDHELKWREGKYKSALTLLSVLTGLSEEELRQLRRPDSERVMTVFFDMLPPDVVADLSNGRVPTPVDVPDVFSGPSDDSPDRADPSLTPDDGGFTE